MDLGQAWAAMTGLPFVYGVWAVREDAEINEESLGAWLDEARDIGCGRTEAFALSAETDGVLGAEDARVYLTRRIRYRFGSREEAGLRAYLDAVRSLARGT